MEWIFENLFFPLFGLAWIIVGIYLWRRSEHLLRNGVKTHGVIYKFAEQAGMDSGLIHPVVSFKTVEKQIWITQKLNIGTTPSMYKIGQKVTMIYDPEDPTKVTLVSSFLNVWVPRLFVAIGGAFLVYGILELIG